MTTIAEIDLDALAANARSIAQRVAPAELLIVVKADAYGHGLEPVVSTLAAEGFASFGALDASTALRVRSLAPGAAVFAWVFDDDDDLRELVKADIELGVTDFESLEAVAHAPGARVHLKLDSGLSRAGVVPERWQEFVARAAVLEREGVLEVVGVWTHIAEVSHDDDSAAIQRFTRAVDAAVQGGLSPSVRHLAASAASLERPDARFDRVRVGAFVYGIAPGDGVGPRDVGVRPVMTLRSRVTSIRDGIATIGYGGASGLLSDAAGAVSVAIRGVRHRIVAVEDACARVRVSDDVAVGDWATLFGPGDDGEATLQEWADAMGTIGEELVTRVHPGIERRWVGRSD